MLIWIKSALSPKEIRDRMMLPDAAFQKDMISYLEACHVGEFLTGTMAEIKAKVPYMNKERRGMHDVIFDEVMTAAPINYKDPTQTLPIPPPPLCTDCTAMMCENCKDLRNWWVAHDNTVDDLILRSNVHSCLRGCLRKDGTCSARFPRDVFIKTEVDPIDGAINVKKLEPMLNCVIPDVTYCLRCNTDVTSLLSGTSIKAVVAYISDYVTKATLKLYHIFDTISTILDKKSSEGIGRTDRTAENTRVMVMQMVNSLTSKLQIGSPMASLYLLDNPDHYTNFNFKPFWWRSC
ncbi:hypothetical protein C8R44DRAFT_611025 [Mycena epipterygia]|nr:hypothetical protein C8R44DRAFT_611025 [Mycena epipterygia]